MEKYAAGILRFRWAVLALTGGLSLTLCLGIGSLHVLVSHDAILPQTHPFIATSNVIESVFGGRNQVIVGVQPRAGSVYEPAVLATVRRITDGLLRIPGVVPSQVLSLTAPQARAILGTDGGMEVAPLVDDLRDVAHGDAAPGPDRTGERVRANPVFLDTIVSRDNSTAVILADFRLGPALPTSRAILEAVEGIVERERTPDLAVRLGGIAVNLAWLERYSEAMLRLFPFALLVVMGVLYASFRSLQGMLIPVWTALLSAAWALGVIGWSGAPLDLANVTTPILIMAVAAGHSVQMLKRYYEEYGAARERWADREPVAASHAAVIASLVKMGPVMLTAGGIAILCFLSLLTFEVRTIRTFGFFAACGVAAALFLELTFVPALRACLPPPRGREVQRERRADRLDRALAGLARLIRLRRWARLGAPLLVLVVVLAFGAGRLDVDNSLKGNFKPDSRVRLDDAALNAHMGGTNTLSLLVEGSKADAMKNPAALRALEDTQRYLERFVAVGKTVSLADYLIRMNRAMHGEARSANRLPESRELVAQYLLLYSAGGDPRDFDRLVDEDYRRAVLTAFVKTDSTAYLERLLGAVEGYAIERFPTGYRVSVGGGIAQGVALNEVIVRGKLLNMVQIGALVGVLSSLVFRSLLAGVLVVLPLGLAVLANFGIMGLAGIRLDIGTAVVAAMAVGIGADYGIYLLYRIREERRRHPDLSHALAPALLTAGKAVVYVALSVGLGYAALVVSDFQFHVRMGLLVAATMAASCLAAVVLIPMGVAGWRPAFIDAPAPGPAPAVRERESCGSS